MGPVFGLEVHHLTINATAAHLFCSTAGFEVPTEAKSVFRSIACGGPMDGRIPAAA